MFSERVLLFPENKQTPAGHNLYAQGWRRESMSLPVEGGGSRQGRGHLRYH